MKTLWSQILEMPQYQGPQSQLSVLDLLNVFSDFSKGQGMKTKNPATGKTGSAFDWSSFLLNSIFKLLAK